MKMKEIFITSAFTENSVWRQILGICSALAVTNLMQNSLIMGLGVIFTLAFANLTISIIRNWTPRSVRMMVQTLIIAAYVIIVDIFLKANLPVISKQLGPYVGLIITNCILMGRAEAFASQNKPLDSFIDGIGAGVGYTLVLLLISFVRELFGFGTIFGFPVFGSWWTKWSIMVMAPSAFFILAMLIWYINTTFYKAKV
ncbi:MAG: NADH:ubiquinone reductase (Na(+)-transporting) subunit D [Candidatus Cloacimonetes bacterium]|jgi:Na+-transporting NADH:ubiquinone oxidoreductase subunit D|nr:NADH:ubiquinone reductase (Na(+)-transporting) subunit D [Candidatus Cloacimonadota bacterium]MDD2544196.1 NADH:ubiquinone reductase (Na(+)-transporting) subunit D [Candidatus Cloacimonadota bacterium]MDD4035099.1 NADH:ubiquinone reductase (Na(+)-transporting) subunit D [Candidatus Cloacimonadota bacterium]MDY0337682.1 NADH:ubiquinone reductase (Na(+)-transporting) subunit D [Candidatus Cloacimonadaceae bacterium]